MSEDFRNIIHKADKYARKKEHKCLVPDCNRRAIRCHAIPREACVEALANNGKLYTQRQSYIPIIKMSALADPPDVVEVGVNEASVFNGYCSLHDTKLFASAETKDTSRQRGMFYALHVRAISLEYCRKRRNLYFYTKVSELTKNSEMLARSQNGAKQYDAICSLYKIFLDNFFSPTPDPILGTIEYYCVPFSRNLQVSCCGVFSEKSGFPETIQSLIAYNMISYADMSFLVLTIYKKFEEYLNSLIESYSLPRGLERLINDIAFMKGEEPLISAKLWRSLSEEEKYHVRLSLRHPDNRTGEPTPRIIKLTLSDVVSEPTPAMLVRLSHVMNRPKS